MQDRRHFLKQASALTVGFAGLQVFASYAPTQRKGTDGEVGFGPLQSDPDGVFDLPEGFSYQIVSRHGDEMDDGFRVPHRPDGMATFPGPDGTTLLVRNHEIDADAPLEEGPFRAGGDALDSFQLAPILQIGRGSSARKGRHEIWSESKLASSARRLTSAGRCWAGGIIRSPSFSYGRRQGGSTREVLVHESSEVRQ